VYRGPPEVYRGPPEVYRGPCMKITCSNQGIISTLHSWFAYLLYNFYGTPM